jgi:hypothetical protein
MADDKRWMETIKRNGSLHRMLGINPKEKIPLHKLAQAAHSSNLLEKRRAVAAENMRKANAGS